MGVVTPSPLARRAPRRRRRARRRASPSPAWLGLLDRPRTRPPRAERPRSTPACARRRWRSSASPLAGLVDAAGSAAMAAVGLARLAGARRSSACAPAAGASWPARRPSPSGPRCCATCSSSNAGLHEAIGKSARVAPDGDPRRGARPLRPRPARRPRRRRSPGSPTTWTTPSPTPSSPRCRSPTSAPCRTSASCSRAVATSTRETVAMQLRINATRARTYRTAQLIAGIVAFFVGLLVLTNRDYMEPFGTFAGQIVLLGVCGLVAGVAVGDGRAVAPGRAERLLRVGAGSAATAGGGARDLGRARSRAMLAAGCWLIARALRRRRPRPLRALADELVAPRAAVAACGPADGVAARWRRARRPAAPGARRRGWRPTSPCSAATPARHTLDKLGYAVLFLAPRARAGRAVPAARRRRPVLTALLGALLSPPPAGATPTSRSAPAPLAARRAWSQALTVYVDIVGISLAGGAGVEDALMVAARAGAGPQFARARRRAARRPDAPPQAVARPRRARRRGPTSCRCASWRRPSTWPPSPARGSARPCWPRPTRCASASSPRPRPRPRRRPRRWASPRR